ncbi:hypothetical protein BKI52_02555 [marine bacterium AO1-C]|nr:hypothetical protein BKI52_02555 [marine bacterium AO1-C]
MIQNKDSKYVSIYYPQITIHNKVIEITREEYEKLKNEDLSIATFIESKLTLQEQGNMYGNMLKDFVEWNIAEVRETSVNPDGSTTTKRLV